MVVSASLILYELKIFCNFFDSLVEAWAHSVLLAGPLSLETSVYSDVLFIQTILVTGAGLAIRKVDDVYADSSFGWFCFINSTNLIFFVFVLWVNHFTWNSCWHRGVSFCFKANLSLLVDYLWGNKLTLAALRVYRLSLWVINSRNKRRSRRTQNVSSPITWYSIDVLIFR